MQDNFNPEVGFAPRIGIRRASGNLGYHYRQSWGRGFLREIYPHSDLEYFTDQQGQVVSRYFNAHLSLPFQNGGMLELGHNRNLERPLELFEIHPTTTIEPELYTFDDQFVMLFTDPSRLLSGNVRLSVGDFYSGTRRSLDLGAGLRLGERFTAELGYSANDIEVEEGSFTTHLLTTRFKYSFSTNMFLLGLIQYNDVYDEWSTNIRFNLIHRPLSDIFIVYNERRDVLTGKRLDRALTAKFTYLLDF